MHEHRISRPRTKASTALRARNSALLRISEAASPAPATSSEQILRIRNTSVTEFAFNPKRHQLVTYNTLPHLDAAAFRDWVTYA